MANAEAGLPGAQNHARAGDRLGRQNDLTMGRIETYVIGVLEEILGQKDEKNRFDWAVGDKSPKTGRCVQLPFDGVWERHKLIVEVDEPQHRRSVAFWNKPTTVSGVARDKQRRKYDKRKQRAAKKHGYTVLRLEYSRRPKLEKWVRADVEKALRAKLAEKCIDLGPDTSE
jgi:hypothetical protein